ncbi:hypothetical protein GCM10009526_26640 [Glutamicibacter creatinolyticus]
MFGEFHIDLGLPYFGDEKRVPTPKAEHPFVVAPIREDSLRQLGFYV